MTLYGLGLQAVLIEIHEFIRKWAQSERMMLYPHG